MPLSPQEQAELDAINQELGARQQAPMGGLTPEEKNELAMIEQELATRKPQAEIPVNPQREADLGFVNRSRYSIEPLQSNRMALLAQEYGQENVMQDKEGNLFLNQNGEFRPVNKEGFSVADIADFAGATPEMAGSAVGLVAGAVGGGGVASVPAAIGLGAAGGAVGSVARQGLSAILGTPQVANAGERIVETGLSSIMGGAGTGVGIGAKAVVKKAAPALKKIFPSFGASKEGLKLISIAKKEGIPLPTSGQVAGGRDLVLEKALAERPVFGRAIRKQTDAQINAIKNNLAKTVGDFMDIDSTSDVVGSNLKKFAGTTISQVKKQASQMFDDVAAAGKDAMIPRVQMKSELVKNLSQIGLFDQAGNPLEHASKTGLTETQFNRLQGIFKSILRDIDNSGIDLAPGVSRSGQSGQYIDANTLNTMRKFIDSNIREGKNLKLDDALLIKMRDSFLDATENLLGSKDVKLKDQFKQARSLWSRQLRMKDISSKLGLDPNDLKALADEKVVSRIFADSKNVKLLKELVGDKPVEDAGVSFLNELFSQKLGKEGQVGAAAALNIVKKNKRSIIESIGVQKYNSIRNNLMFLDKIGSPINPSKTEITRIMTDLTPTGLTTGALQRVQRATRASVSGINSSLLKNSKNLPKIGGRLGNLLSDESQRVGAYYSRGPRRIANDEKEQKNNRRPGGE